LGPFKYVLATPVFHRWHHTALEEGGNTNFAGTFPVWDILFGTFRMPENALPESYGKDEAADADRDRRTTGLSVPPIGKRFSTEFAVLSQIEVTVTVSGAGSAAYRFRRLVNAPG